MKLVISGKQIVKIYFVFNNNEADILIIKFFSEVNILLYLLIFFPSPIILQVWKPSPGWALGVQQSTRFAL